MEVLEALVAGPAEAGVERSEFKPSNGLTVDDEAGTVEEFQRG